MRQAFEEKAPWASLQTVPDGRSAIEYLEGTGRYADRAAYPRPRLVLLDINMPFLSGFDVLRWMRGRADQSGIAAYLFSSSERPEDLKLAEELQADGYIVKPWDPTGFTRSLEAVLPRLR